jgi:hypothetical protein
MPRHTIGEWWVIYCLRFGPETITKDGWVDGEEAFIDLVAEDHEVFGEWRRGSIISRFRGIRTQETRAGSNPH